MAGGFAGVSRPGGAPGSPRHPSSTIAAAVVCRQRSRSREPPVCGPNRRVRGAHSRGVHCRRVLRRAPIRTAPSSNAYRAGSRRVLRWRPARTAPGERSRVGTAFLQGGVGSRRTARRAAIGRRGWALRPGRRFRDRGFPNWRMPRMCHGGRNSNASPGGAPMTHDWLSRGRPKWACRRSSRMDLEPGDEEASGVRRAAIRTPSEGGQHRPADLQRTCLRASPHRQVMQRCGCSLQ